MVTIPIGPRASVRTNSYGMLAEFSASRRPDRRYRVVKRLALAFILGVAGPMLPVTALAEDQPFKTVVDGIDPKTPGLTIQGSAGGCLPLLQTQSGQDVILSDLSNPATPLRYAAP